VVTRELFDAGVVASAAITPVVIALVSDAIYIAASGRRGRPAPAPGPEPSTGGEPTMASTPPPQPRRRIPIVGAILIGLLAFVIAVLVLTIPEAVSGTSITGSNEQTTLFGSNEDKPWNTGDQLRDCFDGFEAFGDCLDEIFG
jgi:hypothetical protein